MRKTKTRQRPWLGVLMSFILLFSLTNLACSELELPGPDAGVLLSLAVLPATAPTMTLANDKVDTQTFNACASYTDSEVKDLTAAKDKGKTPPSPCPAGTEDVTDRVEWRVEPSTLGRMQDNQFRTEIMSNGKAVPSAHGGQGRVVGTFGNMTSSATVNILYRKEFLDKDVPADASKKFGGAQAGKVTVIYPPTTVLVPPNLGQIEVQFTPPAASTLYQLEFISAKTTVRIYTKQKNYNLTLDQWRAVGVTSAGTDVRLRVLATKYGAGVGVTSVSANVNIRIAEKPVVGGLYYWVVDKHIPGGTKPTYGAIYRYNFEKPKVKADPYLTKKEVNDCVGCHSLSRGGKHIAFTFSGGNGDGAIYDVERRQAMFDSRKGYKADLQTFNPDGTEVIVVNQGKLTRRAVADGKLLESIPTGSGKATHPDWGPKGNKLLFVKVADKDYHSGGINDDVHFRNGSIYIMERSGGKWSTPKLLVKGGNGGANFYYPTFSPEADWIVFNRSTGDSYSDEDANIYIIKPDGKGLRALSKINGSKISNSWPKWSPKVEKFKNTTLYWLTFSSVRNYGVRLLNSKYSYYPNKAPQIWMTAFDVNKANLGQEPTQPAFWLPFQDLAHHNHIAQWTQKVVELQ